MSQFGSKVNARLLTSKFESKVCAGLEYNLRETVLEMKLIVIISHLTKRHIS